MTSNLKGIEPPLPTGTPTFIIPPHRPSSQYFQQPPRSWPHQTSTLVHNAPARTISRDALDPPLKRQKLESSTGSSSHTVGVGGSAERDTLELVPSSQHASGSGVARRETQSQVHEEPFFPIRPGGQPAENIQQNRPLAVERAARQDVVPVKAYVPEPPSCAPRYHEAGPADFFPWTGHHPEDLLNELTTKQGYFDKSPSSQNESSPARPSVWSSLKYKSGLQILSSLFVSALDQRQAYGMITASSTFKPPPRVTLTDTKREAWLRDLANPLIPLRRLSRTIPHGVRGKVLLDHCLSKDIPTSRAIWLAKCVGANEIRAFKRKGTSGVFTVGGEAKWIKDWSTNIEQFLESIIGSCGSPGWKHKITYGLRLVSHLYSENLLDQDHYLDWLINSIENSDLDSLPILLLVQKIYQQEFLRHRQRGKRLASAFIAHLHNTKLPANREFYDSVSHELVQLTRSMIIAAPACFLQMQNWDLYKGTIEENLIDRGSDHLRLCYEDLLRRNADLRSHSLSQNRQSGGSEKQRIISLLDTLSTEPKFGKVAGACLCLACDTDILVKTCIEWSASIYRHDHCRIYVAARLLRIWNKRGVELQRPIIELLAANPNAEGMNREILYGLLAGLVSSKHLSVGKYLQWLMARGKLHDRHEPGPECPCDVGLLFEIPLHGLPAYVLNLRRALVSSTSESYSAQESQVIAKMKADIAMQLPGLFKNMDKSITLQEHPEQPVYVSQSVKSDVARWVRQTLISRFSLSVKSPGSNDDNSQMKLLSSRNRSIITLAEYQTIRRTLENIGDLAILADVLDLLSEKVDGQTLTAATDTINFHYTAFNALGAADGLFRKMFHHVEIGDGQELEEAFLESLIDLGCRTSGTDSAMRRLRKELSAHTPRPSAIVCSPISETMVEALQLTEPTFADEMDQLLASGTSIDKQNLTRVFGTIISHLEKAFDDSSHLVIRYSRLLAHLRGFRPKQFDLLFNEWFQSWLRANQTRNFSNSLGPMICSKVSSLDSILESVIGFMDTSGGDQYQKAELALDVLALVVNASSEKMTVVEYRSYRLHDQLQSLLRTPSKSLLALIRVALNMEDSKDPYMQKRPDNYIQRNVVKNLAHSIILQQVEPTSGSSRIVIDFYLDPAMQIAVGDILHLSKPGDIFRSEPQERITAVLNKISEFNIALAQLELRAILASSHSASGNSIRILSENMVERAKTLKDDDHGLLAYLVSDLSSDQASPIRERAENEVLAWALKDGNATSFTQHSPVPALMAIIEAAAFCVSTVKTWPLMEEIVEALTNILPSPQLDNGSIDSQKSLQSIDILLRLLIIHQSTIRPPKSSQSFLFHLLMCLSLLLIHPILTSSYGLSNRIHDVLTLFSDSISDDTRSRCVRCLRDHHRTRDPRLRFIFGYSDVVESERLQFITKPLSAAESSLEGSTTAHPNPYPLRRWEMMQDATPVATENDTSLSLTLFGSRKSVL